MLALHEIRRLLQDRRIPIVSRATGVHHSTIYAIRDGRSANPSYQVLQRLSDYLTASIPEG